jgi:hypothetical protein
MHPAVCVILISSILIRIYVWSAILNVRNAPRSQIIAQYVEVIETYQIALVKQVSMMMKIRRIGKNKIKKLKILIFFIKNNFLVKSVTFHA